MRKTILAGSAAILASGLRVPSQRELTLNYVARQDSMTSATALHHAYGSRCPSLTPPHNGKREMARRAARLAKRGS